MVFEDYWGTVPNIVKVGYLVVSRVEIRAFMAESGEAEFFRS